MPSSSRTPVPLLHAAEAGAASRPGVQRSTLLVDRPAPVPPRVADRLRGWVRCVLDLDDDATVLVSEIACRDAGCAPVETVLAVLRPGATVSSRLPGPADRLCAADVLTAFQPVDVRRSS